MILFTFVKFLFLNISKCKRFELYKNAEFKVIFITTLISVSKYEGEAAGLAVM